MKPQEFVEVVMVNLPIRQLMIASGEICSITRMIDNFGDDTDEPSEAIVVVAAMADGRSLQVDVRPFKTMRPH